MITPNVIIFQKQADGLEQVSFTPVINPPVQVASTSVDPGVIEKIRNQPLPNDIEVKTESKFKNDIKEMVNLLNAYCKTNAISEIKSVVRTIHEMMKEENPAEIKGWTKLICGAHPEIDSYIKSNLAFWKNPYSEVMGTNTVLYYADTSNIDIMFWAKAPLNLVKSNKMPAPSEIWNSPVYIRESVREKLDSRAVEFIQNAGLSTTTVLSRNTIWDAWRTTKRTTGGEIEQKRPIADHTIANGVSLISDQWHQLYRIMSNRLNKEWGKQDIIYKLHQTGGAFVHVLINHIDPLINIQKAADYNYEFKSPIGIESDTFPFRTNSNTIKVNQSGERVEKVSTNVNNKSLEPIKIEYRE